MMISSGFILFAIFCLGLIIGSFLNCLIYRMQIGRDLGGRSFCPECKHPLAAADLVPVISFIELKGRCRYCGKRISIQYPLVELVVGSLFAAVAVLIVPSFVFGFDLSFSAVFSLFYHWFLISALTVIFVYDLKWYLIPDGAVISCAVAAVLFHGFEIYEQAGAGNSDLNILADPILSAFFAGSFFLAIYLVSRGKWMGFGDVKFAFMMGFVLGFPEILIALFLAFSLGAIIGSGLILLKKRRISSEIPFGPFLVAGTVIALFFGSAIADWYMAAIF